MKYISAFFCLLFMTVQAWACNGVDNGYVKASIPGMSVSAAYFSLTNHGTQSMTIVGARSTASKSTELHNHDMSKGRMVMRRVKQIVIKSGQTFEFKPKGHHIMLIDLKEPLVAGDKVLVTLDLADGKQIDIPLNVKSVKPMDTHHTHGEHSHHH